MTATPESGRFAKVDAVHVAEVGPAAAILYARILWRANLQGGSWPATRGELSAETGLSPDMIRGAVNTLRDKEWLTSERASSTDATLVWTPVLAGQCDVGNIPTSHGDIPHQELGDIPISSYESSKKTPPNPQQAGGDDDGLFLVDAEPVPPVLAADPAAGFDEWYALYPKKTERKAAQRAYVKAVKEVGAVRLLDAIRAQLPGLKAKIAEQGTNQYVKGPAVWLNKGCWADELVPSNVTPIRDAPPRDWSSTYDPEVERQLPPPRTDPFAASGW